MRLTALEAHDRFATAALAHLATADAQGRPHVVAVTFAVVGEQIVTMVDHKPKGTRTLKRLRNIIANPRVSVLVDHYEDDWSRLWWVRADGTAQVHERGGPEAVRLLQAKYEQYRVDPPDGAAIVVTVERWSGWSGQA